MRDHAGAMCESRVVCAVAIRPGEPHEAVARCRCGSARRSSQVVVGSEAHGTIPSKPRP